MSEADELEAKGYSIRRDNTMFCVIGVKPYRVGFRSYETREEAIENSLYLINEAVANKWRPIWML